MALYMSLAQGDGEAPSNYLTLKVKKFCLGVEMAIYSKPMTTVTAISCPGFTVGRSARGIVVTVNDGPVKPAVQLEGYSPARHLTRSTLVKT